MANQVSKKEISSEYLIAVGNAFESQHWEYKYKKSDTGERIVKSFSYEGEFIVLQVVIDAADLRFILIFKREDPEDPRPNRIKFNVRIFLVRINLGILRGDFDFVEEGGHIFFYVSLPSSLISLYSVEKEMAVNIIHYGLTTIRVHHRAFNAIFDNGASVEEALKLIDTTSQEAFLQTVVSVDFDTELSTAEDCGGDKIKGQLDPDKLNIRQQLNFKRDETGEYKCEYDDRPVIVSQAYSKGSMVELVSYLQNLSSLFHPYLTPSPGYLRGYIERKDGQLVFGRDYNKNVFVTEYRESSVSLSQWLTECRRGEREYQAREALRIAREVGEALVYLHSLSPPITHGDLRPCHVMITTSTSERGNTEVKFSGVRYNSVQWRGLHTNVVHDYVPPECLSIGSIPTWTEEVKLSPFGVLLHNLFVTLDPLATHNHFSILNGAPDFDFAKCFAKAVKSGVRPELDDSVLDPTILPQLPQSVGTKLHLLMRQCWRKTPGKRLIAGKLVQTVDECISLLDSALSEMHMTEGSDKCEYAVGSEEVLKESSDDKSKEVKMSYKSNNFKLPVFLRLVREAGVGISEEMLLVEAVAGNARVLGIEREIASLNTLRQKAERVAIELGIHQECCG